MLLRGENDLKQSNEIQPTSRYVLRKPKGVQKVDSYNYILYKVQPPEVHTPLFPCVILFHYCLLYYTRCNHLEYTHLSFHVWCSIIVYCRRQLFKWWIMLYRSRENIIQWIVQLVFLINTYSLNPVNSVISLLNNQELLCSTWVTKMVGKFACTCWQIIIIRTY